MNSVIGLIEINNHDLIKGDLEYFKQLSDLSVQEYAQGEIFKKVLGEGGDQLVANWIWEQAQNAWVQG